MSLYLVALAAICQLLPLVPSTRAQLEVVQHPLGVPPLPLEIECVRIPDDVDIEQLAESLDPNAWIEEIEEIPEEEEIPEDEVEVDYNAWMQPPLLYATGHLLFNSVASLLQVWPNTMWPAGHSIIPATIPTGTTLYYTSSGNENFRTPNRPDWLAFDPEHAYLFCDRDCNSIVFTAIRPLKMLYFDGASAAKAVVGRPFTSMTTQDFLIWGEARPDREYDEYERIDALCRWGAQYNIDGFIRMSFNFEVLYCDFSDGVQLVATRRILHKASNGRVLGDPLNPWEIDADWRGSLPDFADVLVQAVAAGTWHHHPPGETRVHLDVSRLVSFYDPALNSLTEQRRGIARHRHQLSNISHEDVQQKLEEIQEVLTQVTSGSGIDWRSIASGVINRYASRLEQLNHTLASTAAFRNATSKAAAVRVQLLTMLEPYYSITSVPFTSGDTPVDGVWLWEVMESCSSEASAVWGSDLDTSQERLIRNAVKDTTREICRVLGIMWIDAFNIQEVNEYTARRIIAKWTVQVAELMNWLDWSVWHTCRPACAPDEFCYLSTWPFVINGDHPDNRKPRCIKNEKSAFRRPTTLSRDARMAKFAGFDFLS